MHPALQYDMMQARRSELVQEAARQHTAARVAAADLPRRDRAAAVPQWRVLRLVWRLLPS